MNKCGQMGTTLIELSIAMLIMSLVISGAYQAYRYISRSTERENAKALIQKDIITVSQKMCRDIRMAGLGLPGNGVQFTLSDDSSDRIEIFQNSSKAKSKLSEDISYSNTKIMVEDCSIANDAGWVCIAGANLDTIYRRIQGFGNCTSGLPDTVYLADSVKLGVFTTASTEIYYCNRMAFYIKRDGATKQLIAQRNTMAYPIGQKIDTLEIKPLNSAGAALTSGFEKTQTVAFTVGGYVGKGANRNLVSEGTQVNIRNRD